MVEKIKLALERAYKERELSDGKVIEARVTPPSIEINPVSDTVQPSATAELTQTKYSVIDTNRLRDYRIVTYDDQSESVESFRRLRSHILHYVDSAGVTTIGITSPSADEGKTLTAINLAISLVKTTDTNVVLVDGNISEPGIHSVFGLDVQFGLVDLLNNQVGLSEVIQRVNIANLWIVPGRQETISLAGQANANRVEELVSDFSIGSQTIVIVDLPPILGKDDTLVFTASLDGIVLVVEEGKTKSDEVSRSIGLLKQCNLLGTVLNKASQNLSGR